MQFQFVGPAYTARSLALDAQRTVNLYLEADETGKNPIALFGTPGTRKLATLPTGPVRGLMTCGSTLYAVAGNTVYSLNAAWSATAIGTIGTSSSPVSMAWNGTQLMIVDGSDGWIVEAGTLTQITHGGFISGPRRVTFQDGYFIVIGEGQHFNISALYDGLTWDATDFASAESQPDGLVSCLVNNRELWLHGDSSVEVWYNSGNADFPFERIQGATMETGCAAAGSVAKLDNTLFWLGADDRGRGTVWRATGYQPTRISTHAIEFAIAGYETISDAIAYTYIQEGHGFYVLTFPSGNATWVFDVATNTWHQRAYRNATSGELGRHRANCHAVFDGLHVVGDFEDGRLYALDLDYYSDDGDPLPAIRACAHVSNDLNKIFYHRLHVDTQMGVSGDGEDAQIVLRYSNDGGRTWSNEKAASLGKIGEYRRRAQWRRLGSARDRVFEVTITDPVKRVLLGATLDVTVGERG